MSNVKIARCTVVYVYIYVLLFLMISVFALTLYVIVINDTNVCLPAHNLAKDALQTLIGDLKLV